MYLFIYAVNIRLRTWVNFNSDYDPENLSYCSLRLLAAHVRSVFCLLYCWTILRFSSFKLQFILLFSFHFWNNNNAKKTRNGNSIFLARRNYNNKFKIYNNWSREEIHSRLKKGNPSKISIYFQFFFFILFLLQAQQLFLLENRTKNRARIPKEYDMQNKKMMKKPDDSTKKMMAWI